MIALSVMLVSSIIVAENPATEAQGHFARGAKILELHLYEAEGGTAEGVKEGIDEIERALELGYPDKAVAFKWLGPAYNVLASHRWHDRAAAQELLRTSQRYYRKYLQLKPDDSKMRYRYTAELPEEERIRELREVIRRTPNHAHARLDLADELIKKGNVTEGAEHLKRAAELLNPAEAEKYGDIIVQELRKHGLERDAEEAVS